MSETASPSIMNHMDLFSPSPSGAASEKYKLTHTGTAGEGGRPSGLPITSDVNAGDTAFCRAALGGLSWAVLTSMLEGASFVSLNSPGFTGSEIHNRS